jgi:hypothetical protein
VLDSRADGWRTDGWIEKNGCKQRARIADSVGEQYETMESSLPHGIPTEVPTLKRGPGSLKAGAVARLIPARLAATHSAAIRGRFDSKAAAFLRESRRRFFLGTQGLPRPPIAGRQSGLFCCRPWPSWWQPPCPSDRPPCPLGRPSVDRRPS